MKWLSFHRSAAAVPSGSLVTEPIDSASLVADIKQGEDGAVVVFDGIVRNNTRGRRTLCLVYEAYAEMALRQMQALAEEAITMHGVRQVAMVHRLGRLEVGKPACSLLYLPPTTPRHSKPAVGSSIRSRKPFPSGRKNFLKMERSGPMANRFPPPGAEVKPLCAAICCALSLFGLAVYAQRTEPPTISVNVRLVNVFVNVTDDKGSPIPGLTRDDFLLSEDDHPQKIAVFERQSELPLEIVLAIDTSGSVHKDLLLEQEAAKHFVHSLLRPVDHLDLMEFADNVREVVFFTNNPAASTAG